MRARSIGSSCVASIALTIALAGTSLAQAPSGGAAAECRACGRVVSIRVVSDVERWQPLGSAVGTAAADLGSAGGVPASVVSSYQFNRNADRGVVMLGSAGGANYKQQSRNYERKRWEATVKLDSGETRVVTSGFEPFVREGDRVRVAGNNLELLD